MNIGQFMIRRVDLRTCDKTAETRSSRRGTWSASSVLLHTLSILAAILMATVAVASPLTADQGGGGQRLTNGQVTVQFQAADGRVIARFAGIEQSIVWGGPVYRGRSAVVADVTVSGFQGKALRIVRADGDVDEFVVLADVPLLCLRRELCNRGQSPRTIHQLHFEPFRADVSRSLDQMTTLGCDGLTPADEKRLSYTFLATAQRDARNGLVAGWVTHRRGSGLVGSHPESDRLVVEAVCQYGNLRLAPSQSTHGEILAVGRCANALDGLESLAKLIGRLHHIRLPPIPNGYCTWYSKPHGGAADAKAIARLADFARDELAGYGFDTIQIDDRWQAGKRPKSHSGPNADFTRHNPKGPYPDGMQASAETLHRHGIRAGIWLLPFAWYPEIPPLKEHSDWFVHKQDGSIYYVSWAGWCLDMTQPAAREFLRHAIQRITAQWGYKYLKLDGLWSGMAVKTRYPKPDVGPDNLGDAVFHDPRMTNVEAYRAGLKTVRKAAGKDVYLLGCNIAQNMRTLGASFGLLDGMRVGRDIGTDWSKIIPCVNMGSRLYWLHNRVWHNDPDCLMLREPLTLDMARAWSSWIALSGQLNMVSEWLPGLPAERLDIYKRSIPNTGLCGRPLDLFEHRTASVWHLHSDRDGSRRDVIGLFNWNQESPQTLTVDPPLANLPADQPLVGFDYWQNRFLPVFRGSLKVAVPEAACRILAIRPAAQYPQVVSTSRHITQGIVDLADEQWDVDRGVLSGTSRVVAGEPYELRVALPNGTKTWRVGKTSVSPPDRQAGVTIGWKQTGPHLRVTVSSPTTRAVDWSLDFLKIPL